MGWKWPEKLAVAFFILWGVVTVTGLIASIVVYARLYGGN